jgi:hypothetical protein
MVLCSNEMWGGVGDVGWGGVVGGTVLTVVHLTSKYIEPASLPAVRWKQKWSTRRIKKHGLFLSGARHFGAFSGKKQRHEKGGEKQGKKSWAEATLSEKGNPVSAASLNL